MQPTHQPVIKFARRLRSGVASVATSSVAVVPEVRVVFPYNAPPNKRMKLTHRFGGQLMRGVRGNLMTDAPTIRAFSANEWRVYRDLRLRALADSPDAFGSTLAAETGHLDAEWARQLASSVDSPLNLPLVAEVRGEPIGLAWGRIDTSDPDLAALYQMWVAPSHRGVDAGQMLLKAVIAWARARNASSLDLGVTCGDSPARRLYERAGFQPMGEPQPLRPGSTLLAQAMRLALRGAAEQGHRADGAARRSS
jgi:ribosomal protein S18 acetylase RimI-like enzyme